MFSKNWSDTIQMDTFNSVLQFIKFEVCHLSNGKVAIKVTQSNPSHKQICYTQRTTFIFGSSKGIISPYLYRSHVRTSKGYEARLAKGREYIIKVTINENKISCSVCIRDCYTSESTEILSISGIKGRIYFYITD